MQPPAAAQIEPAHAELLLPAPAFLDPENPFSLVKLRAGAEAWEIVTSSGGHEKNQVPKEVILSVLNSHPQYGSLSNEAKERIAIVANWNKKGGATKTQATNCHIPDDCIDPKRYPLFMARAVLQELIESLQSTRSVKPC